MHLDTVFTQIDINKFAIYSNYKFDVYKLTYVDGKIKAEKENKDIAELMTEIFGVQATLLQCGGGDPIHAGREQ
jgi:arginine deiminase